MTALFFILTVLLTLVFVYRVFPYKTVLALFWLWTTLQTLIAMSGAYYTPQQWPPRLIIFGVAPAIMVLFGSLIFKTSRTIVLQADLIKLTQWHVVRIPVEIALYFLYRLQLVPIEMTFEGNNFDILSGISALILILFVFNKMGSHKWVLLIWNLAALALLVNIVVTAVLAFPSPLQKIAFEQPNIAVTQFPYVLLPTCIVPLVLFAHIIAIIKLFKQPVA